MGGRALAVRIRRHQGKDLMRAEVRAKRDAFLHKLKSRPAVMGILNLTPDSFSDGGRFQAFDAAIAHAKSMVVAGCDIVDIGGEVDATVRDAGLRSRGSSRAWERS